MKGDDQQNEGSGAERVTGAAAEAIERASGAIGRRLDRTAHAVRRSGSAEGLLGSGTSGIADRLERAGAYLERTPLRGMVADLENVVRRRPLRASVVGLVAAFLMGRRLLRRA